MYIRFNVSKRHPLVQQKLQSVPNQSEFVRNLIRDDLYCHDILTADLSANNPPPAYDVFAGVTGQHNVHLSEDTDQDLIQHISQIEKRSEYITDLVYYSIGEDPERHRKKNIRWKPTITKQPPVLSDPSSVPDFDLYDLLPIIADALLDVYDRHKEHTAT